MTLENLAKRHKEVQINPYRNYKIGDLYHTMNSLIHKDPNVLLEKSDVPDSSKVNYSNYRLMIQALNEFGDSIRSGNVWRKGLW